MNVSFLIGANAYACIEHNGRKTDIRLSPGKGAAQSLREYAADERKRAARILETAAIAERAAMHVEPIEYIQAGERLWNGRIVSHGLAMAYNSLSDRVAGFQREGRPVPEHLLNGRHNLIAA